MASPEHQPTRQDLVVALDEFLAGKKVSQPTTPVAGCYITRTPQPKGQATVTYAGEVSRILQNRCQECHRPGQIGPMSLLTYDDAANWSAMIREVVSDKRMPPWHADSKHGQFSNDRSLTKVEHDTLLTWIDQGCPKGDDKALPPPRKWATGWNIGTPDTIITMPKAYQVPAKAPPGGVPYQHFLAKKFEEDTYIEAIECKPGAPEVVHHMVLFVIGPGANLDGLNPLATWVPGDRGLRCPPGSARKIAKGSTLIFQMHYTPNGFAQEDKSSVALVYAKKPSVVFHSKIIYNRDFVIPPGADNHKVTGGMTFDKEVILWNLMPHMHLRGKSFEYAVTYPDGKREVLLSVPRYDFAWQTTYILAKPVRLPAGTKLECVGFFDNSKANLNNPDPTATVRFGLQTWQEMLAGVIDYQEVEEGRKPRRSRVGRRIEDRGSRIEDRGSRGNGLSILDPRSSILADSLRDDRSLADFVTDLLERLGGTDDRHTRGQGFQLAPVENHHCGFYEGLQTGIAENAIQLFFVLGSQVGDLFCLSRRVHAAV